MSVGVTTDQKQTNKLCNNCKFDTIFFRFRFALLQLNGLLEIKTV
jgi:hypothetical protein